MRTIKHSISSAALITTLLLAASPAKAVTYNLIATPTPFGVLSGMSGWTITFNDADNDQLLNINEITSFSGANDGLTHATIVTSLANVAGVTDAPLGPLSPAFWAFGNSTFDSAPTNYTYSLQQVGTVPLPGALPLFVTGLGALGLLGWRRKRNSEVG